MKKFYLMMLAMLTAIAANATTVYFENTDNWSTVNAYAWNPENADWPGLKVTTTVTVTVQGSSETKTLYAYELPGAQTNIIFNNGNNQQTADLPATDGAVYSYAANYNFGAGTKYPIGSVSGNKFIPAGEVEITYGKIYVPVKSYDHSVAYIYAWEPTLFGRWAGKQMTKVTENGIDFWMVEVDENDLPVTVAGWLLCEGSDAGKTGDLPSVTFQKDYVYELNGKATPLADFKLEDIPVDYTSWYLNVPGGFNEWTPDGVALNADGVATVEKLAIGDSDFKLKIWNGTADMWLSTGSALLAGKAYSITGNADANMTIDGAKAGYTYNVTYDAVNQTMQVDWAGEPLEVFVIGELKEKYQAGDEIRFGTNYPDEATIYFTFGSDIEIPDFGLIEVPEDQPAAAPSKLPTATDYNTTGINIYNPDQPIVFQDEALALNYVAYSKAMGASAGQRLVIGANGETTGIENVAVDSNDAPVEFFNLQGVRVANPSNGVFIRRQGNTASKVYVK